MRLLVVNPNTTVAMTDVIAAGARLAGAPGTRVDTVGSSAGPASVESHYDEALSVPGLLAEVVRGEDGGYDGFVVACFGDPGLAAAREVASGPVVGIAEAGMRTASYLGRTFSVVTSLERTVPHGLELVQAYGMTRACAGVHACDIQVLDLESDPDAFKNVLAACRLALEQDASDALVLGCAGMAGLAVDLASELGVPVVEPVAAAVAVVEGLVRLGLRTGSHGEFAAPPPKPVTGPLAHLAR